MYYLYYIQFTDYKTNHKNGAPAAPGKGEKMKVIETNKAPGAIGPYSQGYEVGQMVYTSGQIPVNPENGQVPEGIAAQARQSCLNVGAILEAAGTRDRKSVV